jgi:L-alanine-DL-glutamate epimerase-like enolase superfamily enzyme
MGITRRNFIWTAGLGAGAAKFCGLNELNPFPLAPAFTRKSGKFTFRFRPYELQLTHTFTISGNSRNTTAVMLTELEFEGITGYGEASMPPYLGESHATATAFLSKVKLDSFSDPFRMEEILAYIDAIEPHNCAAKASFDIALHDLVGKLLNQPWYKIWGLSPENTPLTSFTIGIDSEEIVRQKVKEASVYKILKVKLGRETDKMMINTIRSATDVPICVDVNQGWKDRKMALDMIFWLKDKGVVFIEQPMPKEQIDDMAWLTQHSPLPTMADEFLQRFEDVKKAYQVYSGINIKLMKCTGMREAYKMLQAAKALDMKIMIGCMTETSCAVSAASHLSPLADWADLDGNLLISNDVFDGMKVINGKVTLTDRPGIGIIPKKD